jgi:organic radical activating enzyme
MARTRRVAGPTAALAGVPAGVQAQGVWVGRRQLFVRFAAEAETATMYTADALVAELDRVAARSPFHSLAIAGRDPLGNAEFLVAVLEQQGTRLPVLLDTDGQRPEVVREITPRVSLVQVTLELGAEPASGDAAVERALQTVGEAARLGREHAVVLVPSEQASDGRLLRIVEQAHAASASVMIVVHPTPAPGAGGAPDRRWSTLLERASALHADVRLALRIPPPLGLR